MDQRASYPLLESVHRTGERVTVEGSVESERSAEFLLDLYANRAPQNDSSGRTYDSSDRGEGEIYLTTVTVRTNEAGLARFSLTATGVRAGDELSATLTKTRGGDELTRPTPSTGEFSPARASPESNPTRPPYAGQEGRHDP